MNLTLDDLVKLIKGSIYSKKYIKGKPYVVFSDGRRPYALVPEEFLKEYLEDCEDLLGDSRNYFKIFVKPPEKVLGENIPGYVVVGVTTNLKGKVKNFYHMLKNYVKNLLLTLTMSAPILAIYAMGFSKEEALFFGGLLLALGAISSVSGIKENLPYDAMNFVESFTAHPMILAEEILKRRKI